MAKLLTYDGQVIDPTAYIYINLKLKKHIKLDPNSKAYVPVAETVVQC